MGNKAGYCESCPLFECEKLRIKKETQPRLLIVGAFPTQIDLRYGAFTDYNMKIVKQIIENRKNRLRPPDRNKLTVDYRYAIMCCPFTENKEFIKPSAEDIYRCSVELKNFISRKKPEVVVLLGTDAFKALGYKSPIKAIRGSIFDQTFDGKNVKVVTTYHPLQVAKTPGVFEVFRKDIDKAINLALGSMEQVEFKVEYPTEYENVVDALNRNIEFVKERNKETGKRKLIAVDTETTSLEPYKTEERMIAISLSTIEDYGLAFLVDHRNSNYTEEQKKHILQLTEQLLDPKHAMTVAANAKFDYKWLNFRYGIDMEYFSFDVLLAEHILDEDKKGEYSLKDLIKDYFPSMGQYEEELSGHFKQIKEQKNKQRKDKLDEHKVYVRKAFLDWWVSLSEQERRDKLSRWVNKGYVNLSATSDLVEIKTKKYKGQQVVMKKYQNAVYKMLKKIPEKELEGIELPQFEEQDVQATFEDLPVDVMLKYAAIDALGTYKVFRRQNEEMNRDTNAIANKYDSLPTLHWSLINLSMPLNEKIAHMEYNGVLLDREKCQDYMNTMDEYLEKYKDEVFMEVGRKFTMSSSAPDLKQILFDEMGFTPIEYTETGEPSTNETTIKALYEKSQTQFLKSLLAYRKIEKARNTYIRGWLNMSKYDGRLHANFHQNVTATYRLSSSHPNL